MDDSLKTNSLTSLVSSMAGQSAELSGTATSMYNLRLYAISNNRSMLSSLYNENGLCQALIDIPVEDAFRGGLDITSPELSESDITEMQDYLEENNVLLDYMQGLKWKRLFGGAGLIINAGQTRTSPFNIEKITERTPLEFYPVDRWELMAPLTGSPVDQFLPMFQPGIPFTYYGHQLDQSHVLIMKGRESPSLLRAQFMGWGVSEIERMIRSFNMYSKHSTVVFELLDESKIDIFGIQGMNSALASAGGTAKIAERVALASKQKSYTNAMAMDVEDSYTQKQLSYSGLSEILEQIRIGVASDSRFPMTKLFGLTPSGLSATSDDIENYNSMVESEVRAKARPGLRRLLRVCFRKVYGFEPSFKFKYQPLRELSALDQSSVQTQKLNRILATFQNGVITSKSAAEQINHEHIFSTPIPVDEALELEEVQELRHNKPAPVTPGYGAGTSVVTT